MSYDRFESSLDLNFQIKVARVRNTVRFLEKLCQLRYETDAFPSIIIIKGKLTRSNAKQCLCYVFGVTLNKQQYDQCNN